MTSDYSAILWHQLECEQWKRWPAMSDAHLVKFVTTDDGYGLVVIDGLEGWFEHRDTTYITEKAEDWAACVEADSCSLADLMLQELMTAMIIKSPSSDNVSPSPRVVVTTSSDVLKLELSSHLDGLPYSWHFSLSRVEPVVMSRLLTLPLTTVLSHLTETLRVRDEELRRLRQKLEDLTPDEGKKNAPPQTSCSSLTPHASSVVSGGVSSVMSHHLTQEVYTAIRDSKEGIHSTPPIKSPSKGNVRLPRARRPHIGVPKLKQTELQNDVLSEAEQTERRNKIKNLANVSDSEVKILPKKKKKKLNL